MYGHTHKQQFEVVRSFNDNKNIGVNFITGCLTSEQNYPNFAVFEIDAEYMLPVNIKVYDFYLDKSNQAREVFIEELMDYVSYYSLSDIGPDGMFSLA
jgi:hypothetical protein